MASARLSYPAQRRDMSAAGMKSCITNRSPVAVAKVARRPLAVIRVAAAATAVLEWATAIRSRLVACRFRPMRSCAGHWSLPSTNGRFASWDVPSASAPLTFPTDSRYPNLAKVAINHLTSIAGELDNALPYVRLVRTQTKYRRKAYRGKRLVTRAGVQIKPLISRADS